ncbi:DNA glycosylase [Lasiosphaeria hispida]|uniref:Adenine DNA glycosylase n=1 Tax=Lasiosphaeria hispida TaxID=260671 RepID=A0AAJ0MA63_9PEZI|nr:DNA glycosylase [Lasiosphaeria hispida]
MAQLPIRQSRRVAAQKATLKLQRRDDASDTDHADDTDDASPPTSQPSSPDDSPKPTKRRKPPLKPSASTNLTPTTPTPRTHPPTYHHPPLLTASHQTALLTWYSTTTRPMPWRQPFSPSQQRAYEVWISEIMLQQTRVATVVTYWTAWMARFPTLAALAAAAPDDVLAAWRGLGYYSRARRVHAAAGVCEARGGMPGTVGELVGVPGVGRYTAGAIAAIVFGRAEAMVDGNVERVLARQMGVYAHVKERRVGEAVWEAAQALVESVAAGEEVSERPGLWGQALMELGSTVCTPAPRCGVCPVTASCRVYQEGYTLAMGGSLEMEDVEECGLCAPFEDDGIPSVPKRSKQQDISPFFATPANKTTPAPDARTLEIIISHARRFPLKKPKKKVREEETLVCAIRAPGGRYLIHRRPEKGMLAGLWEFPSHLLPASNDSAAKARKVEAVAYVSNLASGAEKKVAKGKRKREAGARHVGELGSIPWLFSHLKLTMHVHLFEVDDVDREGPGSPRSRWASSEDIDKESMGTGMRKCWTLIKEAEI